MQLRAVLCLSLAAACATSNAGSRAPQAAADEIATSWTEWTTEHFILDTDASQERATSMLATLERLRAADMIVLTGGDVEVAGRVRVIAPLSRGVLLDIAGPWVAAFYTHGPYSEPLVLAPVDAFATDPATIAHELAHAVSYYLFPEQQHWFTEGLAEFVETLGSQSRGTGAHVGSHIVRGSNYNAASVGAVPENYQFADATTYAVPPAKLLAWNGVEDSAVVGRYHVWSWVLYHWLWNNRSKDLSAFQRRLSDGEGWDAAWAASFPDLDPKNAAAMAKLDADLREYRQRGRFVMARIDAKAAFKTTSKRASSADMRLLLLYLRERRSSMKKEERVALAREQLQKARLEDPRNPQVLVDLASLGTGKIDAAAARSAAAGAPRDFRGWYLLGASTSDPAEKEASLRKSIELAPDCAACNNELAWFLVQTGRAKEALPFANRAVDLAPWSAAYIDTLAAVALGVDQCPQAVTLQARALRIARAKYTEKAAQPYEQNWSKVQSRCNTGAVQGR